MEVQDLTSAWCVCCVRVLTVRTHRPTRGSWSWSLSHMTEQGDNWRGSAASAPPQHPGEQIPVRHFICTSKSDFIFFNKQLKGNSSDLVNKCGGRCCDCLFLKNAGSHNSHDPTWCHRLIKSPRLVKKSMSLELRSLFYRACWRGDCRAFTVPHFFV